MKLDDLKKFVKDVDKGKIKTLKPNDKFQFRCTACGKCCFGNNVIMTVYDLIRLRHALKIPTQEILKRQFLNFYVGSSSGLPVLTINFEKFGDKLTKCPFLAPAIHITEILDTIGKKAKTKEEKQKLLEEYRTNPKKLHQDLQGAKIDRWLCSVHKDRPIICRLFPLGRIKKVDKKDLNKFEELFVLQKEVDWCPGWKQKDEYTLKQFLDEAEFWQSKEGSDKSHQVMNKLLVSGFFALTKDNQNNKPTPKFNDKSPVLMFLGNLLYNFDSINYFSKDEKVIKTITDDKPTHEDFMYVLEKVDKIVAHFIQTSLEAFKKNNSQSLINFVESLQKGGEKKNG